MRFKLGINAKQVHSELKKIDEDAPTIQTIHNWFHLFKKGEKNLKDKRRSGRPITATTDDNNISKIRAFIKRVLMMKLKLSFRSLEGLYTI